MAVVEKQLEQQQSAKGSSAHAGRGEAAAAKTGRLRGFEPFGLGLAGAVLLWLTFPPVGIAALAWVAPLPWLWLVKREKLPGRRPYAQLYVAGLAGWLMLLYWLLLPHWTCAAFGWPAISLYLAFYLPVFVGLTRVAVWRLRVPLLFAAPVVWVGLELARGHLLTGFSMYLLGHAIVHQPELIQIADLGGAYTVSLLVMFVCAALATLFPLPGTESHSKFPLWLRRTVALGLAAAAIAATWGYGEWRLRQELPGEGEEPPRIALIQGSIDTVFGGGAATLDDVFDEYLAVSQDARQMLGPVDLYLWPETMYPIPYYTIAEDAAPPPGSDLTPEEVQQRMHDEQERFRQEAAFVANYYLEAPLLTGASRRHVAADREHTYNSALLLEQDGQVAAVYDKMHPVMFGEYVPFGNWMPLLYELTPLAYGLDCGEGPVAMEVAGWRLAPNVCYESMVPHLIRQQVAELDAAGTPPDALVNVTNDGWFYGSSELDAHLFCSAFRAVECRRPMLVAANTGFSAWIDGNGRILQQGPRHATGFLLAQPVRDGRPSLYLRWGDWLSGACLVFCVGLAGVGLGGWWRERRERKKPAVCS